MPRRFLFVCHGNICRSPYAERAFARDICEPLRHLFEVASAGFIGPERPSPPNALAVAAHRGVDLGDHRSQLLSGDRIRHADVVLVMTPQQQQALSRRFPTRAHALFVLGDFDPEPIDTRTIPDPIEQSPSAFERCYARIDRCNQGVMEATGICSSTLHRSGGPTAAERANGSGPAVRRVAADSRGPAER